MFLTGMGTMVPSHRFSQAECWEALKNAPQYPGLTGRSHALLRRVLTGDSGIDTRHTVIGDWAEAFLLTPDSLHGRFQDHAPGLAVKAARRAMAAAQVAAADLDAILISTCTGYLCPGLTSYVSELLGLRSDVIALDLVGQGCGAALPNLRTADALLAAGRAKHVLTICVEVCSAALYLDDDPGVLISACLFGDGAAAVVCSAQPSAHARRVEWKAAETHASPGDRDALRFETRQGMLRNILSREVPVLAARCVDGLFSKMLNDYPLSRADVTGWVLHAGGREVLGAMQTCLGLSEEDLRRSAAVLRDVGNVSSPFVLFVLERALVEKAPGGWWWMSSFGAGFSCHGALLKVD
ncbi:MAG: stilbene synthase [Verrucomicrobiales bacterium]|nr:stilbene synthase [Verrucomicrobiales bacterium]